MIAYQEAYKIAMKIKTDQFPDFKHGEVVETEDRWVFVFSVDKDTVMTPAPSFFVFKNNGNVEWFSIPPLENLDIIRKGKHLGVIE